VPRVPRGTGAKQARRLSIERQRLGWLGLAAISLGDPQRLGWDLKKARATTASTTVFQGDADPPAPSD